MNTCRLLLCLWPISLMAQSGAAFANLATSSLGDLYLNSSLIVRGTKPSGAGNVFHYAIAPGWESFTPDWGPVRGQIDVSARGDVFAITDVETTLQCVLSNCHNVTTATGRIVAPSYRLDLFPGYVQISRNGRFALLTTATTLTLLDLSSGSSQSFTGSPAALKQAVTDEGCVLLHGSGSREITLHCQARETRFSTVQAYDTAKIDGQESHIVYSFSPPRADGTFDPEFFLREIDLSTGQDTLLAVEAALELPFITGPWGSSPQIWVSQDGQRIIYLARPAIGAVPQVIAIRPDGSARQQLTSGDLYPEGFVEATISPDGATAFAVTPWNRVVKIDLSSGLAAEIVPRTPVVSGYGYGGNGLVPGSMGVIWGTALSDGSASATEPLPLSLREVSVKVGNLDAPMISIEPAAVRYQIPFEATPTLGPTPITIASKSPFEQDPRLSPQNTNITAWDLSFLDLSPDPAIYSGISAIHEDFGSLVTLDNPAEAGEIVHFYAVGLGPVSPAVATGQPSPWNPPARAVDPLLCSMDESVNGASVPVEVLFAGLAPGMSGIYQVSVQLPSSFNLKSGQRYVVVRCSTAGATSDGAVLVAVPNSQ